MAIFLNGLVMQLIYKPKFLILYPGNVVKSDLCHFLFSAPLRILFLLVRFVSMAILTGFLCRLSNRLLQVCHSLHLL